MRLPHFKNHSRRNRGYSILTILIAISMFVVFIYSSLAMYEQVRARAKVQEVIGVANIMLDKMRKYVVSSPPVIGKVNGQFNCIQFLTPNELPDGWKKKTKYDSNSDVSYRSINNGTWNLMVCNAVNLDDTLSSNPNSFRVDIWRTESCTSNHDKELAKALRSSAIEATRATSFASLDASNCTMTKWFIPK